MVYMLSPVAGVQHCVEHRLEQQRVAHPLADDDVELGRAAGQLSQVLYTPCHDRDDPFSCSAFTASSVTILAG